MFEDSIKAITVDEEIAEWLRKGLEERHKNTSKLHENRSQLLQKEYSKVNGRLSKLYDLKLDGGITDEMFNAKENEYNEQLLNIKGQIKNIEQSNPNFYQDGCQILELSNRLYPLYFKANNHDKAKLLRLVASNYTLNDASIVPTYRKPFSFLNEKGSRSIWLPSADSNHGQAG
jgi:hypothetical protein